MAFFFFPFGGLCWGGKNISCHLTFHSIAFTNWQTDQQEKFFPPVAGYATGVARASYCGRFSTIWIVHREQLSLREDWLN